MAVLDPIRPVVVPEVDESAARRTLREQIARLDRELSAACLDACPRIYPSPPTPPLRPMAGPRLLTLGELERVRDELAGRLSSVHAAIAAQAEQQAASR